MTTQGAAIDPAGTQATSPWRMPGAAWKAILLRSWKESSNDNVGLIAAGVAFYGFLAIVPILGAIVLSYGLIASPQTVVQNMQALTKAMPADAAKLVGEQLLNVVKTSDGKKGLGLLIALAVALFGARNGAGAVITALNIAYEEEEKRGFIRLNLLTIGMTAAGVLVATIAVAAIAALAKLEALLPTAPDAVVLLGKIGSYLFLTLAGAAGAAALYYVGPSRAKPQWTWLTPGSVLAAVGWLILTLGFGIYVANFANYNATYGSLGAVVVLLTWLYLSSYVLLLGAELNSECEHQTATDTTTGAPQPLGTRGAWVADHVATSGAPSPAPPPAPAAPPPPAPVPFAPVPVAPDRPSPTSDYLASRITNRAGHLAGLPRIGMVGSALATAGLAMLKRRGRVLPGAGLIAAAAGLAWWSGQRDAPEEPGSGRG